MYYLSEKQGEITSHWKEKWGGGLVVLQFKKELISK